MWAAWSPSKTGAVHSGELFRSVSGGCETSCCRLVDHERAAHSLKVGEQVLDYRASNVARSSSMLGIDTTTVLVLPYHALHDPLTGLTPLRRPSANPERWEKSTSWTRLLYSQQRLVPRDVCLSDLNAFVATPVLTAAKVVVRVAVIPCCSPAVQRRTPMKAVSPAEGSVAEHERQLLQSDCRYFSPLHHNLSTFTAPQAPIASGHGAGVGEAFVWVMEALRTKAAAWFVSMSENAFSKHGFEWIHTYKKSLRLQLAQVTTGHHLGAEDSRGSFEFPSATRARCLELQPLLHAVRSRSLL